MAPASYCCPATSYRGRYKRQRQCYSVGGEEAQGLQQPMLPLLPSNTNNEAINDQKKVTGKK